MQQILWRRDCNCIAKGFEGSKSRRAPCGSLKRTQKCHTTPCANSCKVSSWGKWSKCSEKCDGGTRGRTRKVVKSAKNGGACKYELEQRGLCNEQACANSCRHSPWGAFGRCSKTCGGGKMRQRRHILVPPMNGGKKCGKRIRFKKCNTKKCSKAALARRCCLFRY